MELKLNQNRKILVNKFNKKSTVKDFLTANRKLLLKNPLNCLDCDNNCCQRGWNIELDIVFVNRYSARSKQNILKVAKKYIELNPLQNPVLAGPDCSFQAPSGICRIYELRPFICRAYTCYKEGQLYFTLYQTILRIFNITLSVKLEAFKNSEAPQIVAQNKDLGKIKQLPYDLCNYQINIWQLINKNNSLIGAKAYNLIRGEIF